MRIGQVRIGILLLGLFLLHAGTAVGDSARKVKSQVAPSLPEIAKRLALQGTVRLEVEINPDGKVKSVKALGGHPILIQSAEDAVRKWRFEPGAASKEVVEFNFQHGN
jgi:protein TonB